MHTVRADTAYEESNAQICKELPVPFPVSLSVLVNVTLNCQNAVALKAQSLWHQCEMLRIGSGTMSH